MRRSTRRCKSRSMVVAISRRVGYSPAMRITKCGASRSRLAEGLNVEFIDGVRRFPGACF